MRSNYQETPLISKKETPLIIQAFLGILFIYGVILVASVVIPILIIIGLSLIAWRISYALYWHFYLKKKRVEKAMLIFSTLEKHLPYLLSPLQIQNTKEEDLSSLIQEVIHRESHLKSLSKVGLYGGFESENHIDTFCKSTVSHINKMIDIIKYIQEAKKSIFPNGYSSLIVPHTSQLHSDKQVMLSS